MTKNIPILCEHIAQNIDDGIIVVDDNLHVCYWNKWIADRSRITNDMALGKSIDEIFPNLKDSHFKTVIQNTIENGCPQFLSNLFHDSPINLHPVISAFVSEHPPLLRLDINTIPIKILSSNACIIQIRDVSLSSKREIALENEILKRAKIEKELRESESRYRLLAENTSDIIIKIDNDLRIKYISPSCLYHLGFPDSELNNTRIVEHSHPDDIDNLHKTLNTQLDESEGLTLRHRLKTHNNQFIWFETTAKPYHTIQPSSSGYVLVTRNIEQRIKDERNREELEVSMDRNQRMLAIGQLTGGIAHRFNNLLTSIIGYTELSRTLPTPINPELLAKYLSQVISSSETAKELIIQLQEYSQNRNIPLQPTDMVSAIGNTVKTISSIMPTGIKIELTSTDHTPLSIANKVQIEQILINLCINAKDAMHNDGIIYIEIKPVQHNHTLCCSCHTTFSGQFVSISITDSGIGIKNEDVERVFQPFYTSKSIAEASGLGLSVVHGVVHSLGGHILLDSSTSGSRFTILLPSIKE